MRTVKFLVSFVAVPSQARSVLVVEAVSGEVVSPIVSTISGFDRQNWVSSRSREANLVVISESAVVLVGSLVDSPSHENALVEEFASAARLPFARPDMQNNRDRLQRIVCCSISASGTSEELSICTCMS